MKIVYEVRKKTELWWFTPSTDLETNNHMHYWMFSRRNAQAPWLGGFLTPWMSSFRPGWPIFPYHGIFPEYPSIDTTVLAAGIGACNVTSSFSGHSVINANTAEPLVVYLKVFKKTRENIFSKYVVFQVLQGKRCQLWLWG